jgi:hypothetical protein
MRDCGRIACTIFDVIGGRGRGRGQRPHEPQNKASNRGQFSTCGGFAPATGFFAPNLPPEGVMPYGGPLQRQCLAGFGALGPPAGIPHEAQRQYRPHPNWYGNLPTDHSTTAPISNIMKKFVIWNVCYWCSFDVENDHISMTWPAHLCKALHDMYFTRQNAQQYIALGHPCCTKNRHKMQ